jgi:hypothetical protein
LEASLIPGSCFFLKPEAGSALKDQPGLVGERDMRQGAIPYVRTSRFAFGGWDMLSESCNHSILGFLLDIPKKGELTWQTFMEKFIGHHIIHPASPGLA